MDTRAKDETPLTPTDMTQAGSQSSASTGEAEPISTAPTEAAAKGGLGSDQGSGQVPSPPPPGSVGGPPSAVPPFPPDRAPPQPSAASVAETWFCELPAEDASGTASYYTAGLIATAILVPFTFLILAIFLYSVNFHPFFWSTTSTDNAKNIASISDKAQNAAALLVALLSAFAIWLLVALWFRRFTTARRANPGVYEDLRVRYDALRGHSYAGLSTTLLPLDNTPIVPTPQQQAQSWAAFVDAQRHVDDIATFFRPICRDLRWVSATGYVAIWQAIHRAEELFLLSDPWEEVLAQARMDELRIKDSRIDAADDLLVTLRYVLAAEGSPTVTTLPKHPLSQLQQRMLLAEIRSSINTFRDQRRGGLVRARHGLRISVFFSSVLASLLLALAIVALPGEAPQRRSIITGGVIFVVGALMGLFNQLFIDSQTTDVVEDYGLSTARKLNTPIFSGLAAVGGVLITVLLPGVLGSIVPPAPMTAPTPIATAVSGTVTPPPTTTVVAPTPTSTPAVNLPSGSVPLIDVYNLSRYPFEIVIAMIFGLTPGLLISRLQQKTDSYKADLASTETANRSASLTTG